MILPQIYRIFLNNKKKLLLVIFYLLTMTNNLISMELKNVAQVNNILITNFDLNKRILVYKTLNNQTIKNDNFFFIVDELINEEIKIAEIKKFNNLIDENILKNKTDTIINNNKLTIDKIQNNLEKEYIKNFFKKKIFIELNWNNLISKRFKNQLEINFNEINELEKNLNLNQDQKEKMVKIEINKKINSFSQTHFNKIKQEYFIKKF